MADHTKFQPGISGCPEKQFKPGNPHRWQPGQSGNPSGIPRSRLKFEQAFYTALIEQGAPVEAALLLWECARAREPWAVPEGQIGNLIINVPPGHAKSLLTAVLWPAWTWINHPESRWLFSSYREPLATRDSVKCRRLIESDWYQQRWGDRYRLTDDQNQ